MKAKYILLIIYLTSLFNIHSSTELSFDSSGDGYTLSDDGTILTITSGGEYQIGGEYSNKKIIVAASCSITFSNFILENSGSLTPLLINENIEVEIILNGETTLTDSSSNENDGTIYLKSGASLTISGGGSIDINPNKLLAINGTDDTSLTVNDETTIRIQSSSENAGGIYLRKAITFNDAIFIYNTETGTNHAIDTEGDLKIVKGNCYIEANSGKGFQTENYLYIGEEGGDNNDLTITIRTSNEGIEGKKIIIYSGTIDIEAEEDGINAASSGDDCDETVSCSGNCACYIDFKGGFLHLVSGEDGLDANGDITISGGQVIIFAASESADQPIDQDGLLTISGGTILAAGSSSMGGVSGTTTQTAKTYSGNIESNTQLIATDSSGEQILNVTFPKAATYFYFNYKSSFTITLGGTEITLSDATSQSQGGQGGPGGQGEQGGQTPPSDQGGQGGPGEQGGPTPPSDQGSQGGPGEQGGQTPPSDQGGQGGPGEQGGQESGSGSSSSSSSYDYSSYSATSTNTNLSGETISSTTSGQSAVYITQTGITIDNSQISKSGDIASGSTEDSEFYGINAAVLVQGGGLTMNGGSISTSARGGNSLVATNGGTVTISGTTIKSSGSASARGLHATYGGVITASNMDISSTGGSCATLATDRGEGTVSCSNCTLSTAGAGSPLIYSTGNITVSDTTGTSSAAQAIVVEGKNSATIKDSKLKCTANPNNKDDECAVLIYQSMSGDAESGTSSFNCEKSTIEILSTSSYYTEAPIFYITNTDANIALNECTFTYGSDVFIVVDEGSWGTSGSNGGTVTLTLTNQNIEGDIIVGSSSSLTIKMTNSSIKGTINNDKTAGTLAIELDSDSTITLTGNSYYTSLTNDKSDG